jgi:hypothetical protein
MRFKDMAQLPDEITAAIAELRLDDEVRPIFRLHPKMPALQLTRPAARRCGSRKSGLSDGHFIEH